MVVKLSSSRRSGMKKLGWTKKKWSRKIPTDSTSDATPAASAAEEVDEKKKTKKKKKVPRSPVANVLFVTEQPLDGLSALTDPPGLKDDGHAGDKGGLNCLPFGWRSRKAGLSSLVVDAEEGAAATRDQNALCSPIERDLGCEVHSKGLESLFVTALFGGANQDKDGREGGASWSAAAWLSGDRLCAPLTACADPKDDSKTVRSEPMPRTQRLIEASPSREGDAFASIVKQTTTFPPSTYPRRAVALATAKAATQAKVRAEKELEEATERLQTKVDACHEELEAAERRLEREIKKNEKNAAEIDRLKQDVAAAKARHLQLEEEMQIPPSRAPRKDEEEAIDRAQPPADEGAIDQVQRLKEQIADLRECASIDRQASQQVIETQHRKLLKMKNMIERLRGDGCACTVDDSSTLLDKTTASDAETANSSGADESDDPSVAGPGANKMGILRGWLGDLGSCAGREVSMESVRSDVVQ